MLLWGHKYVCTSANHMQASIFWPQDEGKV